MEHWPDKDYFLVGDFHQGCNLGLAMGKQLDGRWFVGFDIDGEIDLSEFLQLPETLECITNRGRHLIFEVNPDSPLGNWNDILNTRSSNGYRLNYQGALDLRYCRGAMVSPPSLNKNNKEYYWLQWRQPSFLPESEVLYLIRKRKSVTPNIKRYKKWSDDPMHSNKQP